MKGFRVYDKDNRKMFNNPTVDEGIVIAGNGNLALTNDVAIYLADRFIRMDSIGLLDADGVDICEGDILGWANRLNEKRWVVEATKGGWNPFIDNMTTGKPYRYRIIGNIYENPELMDEKH